MEGQTLSIYCKTSDYDALTGTCAAPFYGPTAQLLPQLSAAEGFQLSVVIVGIWAVGFYIKQGRRVVSN